MGKNAEVGKKKTKFLRKRSVLLTNYKARSTSTPAYLQSLLVPNVPS